MLPKKRKSTTTTQTEKTQSGKSQPGKIQEKLRNNSALNSSLRLSRELCFFVVLLLFFLRAELLFEGSPELVFFFCVCVCALALSEGVGWGGNL